MDDLVRFWTPCLCHLKEPGESYSRNVTFERNREQKICSSLKACTNLSI